VDGDNKKCKVELDSIMSKDSTRSAVSMHVESKVKHCQGSCPSTLARVEQIMSKTQDDVAVWDKEVEDMLEQHGLLQQVALGGNNFVVEDMVSLEAEQVPIQDYVVWDCAQHKGLDEMPCPDIVWDEAVLSDLDTHDGLLEQLAVGKEYKDDEKIKLLIEPCADELLTCVGSSSLFLEFVVAAPVVVVAADQVLQKMPCVYDSSQVMNETENKYMGKEFPGLLLHHLSSQACEKKYGIKRNVCLSGKEVGNCKLHVQGQQGGNWMEL